MRTVDLSGTQISARYRRRRIVAASIAILFVVGVAALFVYWEPSDTENAESIEQSHPSVTSDADQSPHPTPSEQDTAPAGLATASITPWEFLKNPYMEQGKLVRLDYYKVALESNGSLVTYQRCSGSPVSCNQFGLISLQFNRMFAPNQALFNVIADDADSRGQGEKQGELLVDMGSANAPPDMTDDWIVTPKEPTPGTNGYGANITVPTVRFVRYALDGDSPRMQ